MVRELRSICEELELNWSSFANATFTFFSHVIFKGVINKQAAASPQASFFLKCYYDQKLTSMCFSINQKYSCLILTTPSFESYAHEKCD